MSADDDDRSRRHRPVLEGENQIELAAINSEINPLLVSLAKLYS